MKHTVKKELFGHKVQVRVRTWEVDWQGVVHNSYYIRYMEIGRLEHRRSYGYNLSPDGTFDDGIKVFVVHNSVDYFSTATLDDVLNIYTRICWVKNSSFCFEHYIEKEKTSEIISEGKGILVNVDPLTNLPQNLPQKFIDEVLKNEIDCKRLV